MWKLIVYQDRVAVGNNIQTRCYVFDFNTKEAAQHAMKFFLRNGCNVDWVADYDAAT